MTVTGVDGLVAALRRAQELVGSAAERAATESAQAIVRGARRRVRGMQHLPHLTRSYDFDVWQSGDVVTAEVGASHEKPQGKLDWFVEYGSPTSAPRPHWVPATEDELPNHRRRLEDVAAKLLEG